MNINKSSWKLLFQYGTVSSDYISGCEGEELETLVVKLILKDMVRQDLFNLDPHILYLQVRQDHLYKKPKNVFSIYEAEIQYETYYGASWREVPNFKNRRSIEDSESTIKNWCKKYKKASYDTNFTDANYFCMVFLTYLDRWHPEDLYRLLKN